MLDTDQEQLVETLPEDIYNTVQVLDNFKDRVITKAKEKLEAHKVTIQNNRDAFPEGSNNAETAVDLMLSKISEIEAITW